MIELKLSRGKVAIIDDEDGDLASLKWTYGTNGYAYRMTYPERKAVYLHREILARIIGRRPERSDITDHRNGDRLDDRRANLRLATPSESMRNRREKSWRLTAPYRGVHRNNGPSPIWYAKIMVNRHLVRLGRFFDPESAARAYDAAARELHGEFATLNFPNG